MTFEMIMAAMALAAQADKYNHPDYDAIEQKYEQEELELALHYHELKEKYPREMLYDRFVLRCTIFIPAYGKDVECLVFDDEIRIYHYTYLNDDKMYDLLSIYGMEYDSVEEGMWISPHIFNDHTGELNKTLEAALGWLISSGLYRRAGDDTISIKCEEKANSLLESRKVKYSCKDNLFVKTGTNSCAGYCAVFSEGVQLREGK